MESVNFFLLQSLQNEYKLINERILFLSKQYRTVYNMNNDYLLNKIGKYKAELKQVGKEILTYRYKNGCKDFNFSSFESLYSKVDKTVNYQM